MSPKSKIEQLGKDLEEKGFEFDAEENKKNKEKPKTQKINFFTRAFNVIKELFRMVRGIFKPEEYDTDVDKEFREEATKNFSFSESNITEQIEKKSSKKNDESIFKEKSAKQQVLMNEIENKKSDLSKLENESQSLVAEFPKRNQEAFDNFRSYATFSVQAPLMQLERSISKKLKSAPDTETKQDLAKKLNNINKALKTLSSINELEANQLVSKDAIYLLNKLNTIGANDDSNPKKTLADVYKESMNEASKPLQDNLKEQENLRKEIDEKQKELDTVNEDLKKFEHHGEKPKVEEPKIEKSTTKSEPKETQPEEKQKENKENDEGTQEKGEDTPTLE